MKFKIFTVTKNEYDLIEDFINYYGTIFGFNNLVIIDNGSDDERVLQVYENYKTKGIDLCIELGYQKDSQGRHFTKHMQRYKNSCDWLIGLDTDEFMVLSNNNECTCDNLLIGLSDILEKLDKSIDQVYVDYFNSFCPESVIKYNRPVLEIKNFQKRTYSRKAFYRSKNFISTENGNHAGYTLNNKNTLIKSVAYLHYHYAGFKRLIEKSRTICIGYDYITKYDTDIQVIQKLKKLIGSGTNGIHRIEQLYHFMVRKYLIDLFIKYIKRLPFDIELDSHIRNFNMNMVETQFKNCRECLENINKDNLELSLIELDELYFNVPKNDRLIGGWRLCWFTDIGLLGSKWKLTTEPPAGFDNTVYIDCVSNFINKL